MQKPLLALQRTRREVRCTATAQPPAAAVVIVATIAAGEAQLQTSKQLLPRLYPRREKLFLKIIKSVFGLVVLTLSRLKIYGFSSFKSPFGNSGCART